MKKLMGRYLTAFLILGLSFGPFSVIADEEPIFEAPVEEVEAEEVPPVEATTTPLVVSDEPAAETLQPAATEEVPLAPQAIETIDPDTYIPGEVIVKFKEQHIDLEAEEGIEESEALAEDLDLTTENLIEGQNVAVLGTETSVESTIALLEANPEVEYAEPNYIRTIEALATSTDQYADLLWALDNTAQEVDGYIGTNDADVDAPEAWALSKGKDVVVAVIDTGIDYTHPDLIHNMWDGSGCTIGGISPVDGCVHGYDFYSTGSTTDEKDNDPASSSPTERHGTHVAGIIAAEMGNGIGTIGIAPRAKIMALRVGSTTLSSSAIVEAIDFAIENGATVINASYSGPEASDFEREAMVRFENEGGIFVAAAANYGNDIELVPAFPASYDLDSVIAVTATDSDDGLAWFSNYGAVSVDLGAPGVDIYSTVPSGSYAFLSGTSMAAPLVTGTVALIRSARPDLQPNDIKAAILDNDGDAPISLAGKTVSEKRLNAHKALIAVSATSSAPVITLRGSASISQTTGSTFTDEGADVADDIDADSVIMGSGSVDTSAAGSYSLVYTATDSSGKEATPVTRTVLITQPPSSGGGGGGGGGGGSTATKKKVEPAKTIVKPKVTPKPVPVPEPSVPRFPQAEVLGASTSYTFTLTLSLSSTGQEVTELQKKLKELGFFSGEATGYFGPMTEAAVKAFQSSKGLASVGTVGPQTRAALNGSTAPAVATDTASLQAQIAVLQAQLALLLAQLNSTH